jgi:hypothetical protein
MLKGNFITEDECLLKEKNTSDKLEVIHCAIKDMQEDLKKALAWQNQFKGGLKAFGIFIGSCGAIGSVIFGIIKFLKHGG